MEPDEQVIFGMLLAGIELTGIAETIGLSENGLESRLWRMLPSSSRPILVQASRRRSSSAIDEDAAVAASAVALAVLVNLYQVRRIVCPVQALTALERHLAVITPGRQMPDAQPISEAASWR